MTNEELIKDRMSLIKTMCFFDLLDFSLKKEELCDYMLGKRWNIDKLSEYINHEKFILENQNYVYLEGRSITLNVRRDKEKRALKLIQKAKKFIKYMQFLPFIRMVGICNGLSFYDSEKGSDIDVFIITEKKRIFTARLFAFFFTQLLRIRRHGKRIKGRFCLSFLISKEAMDFEPLKLNDHDIYFFYWIRLMQPVIGFDTYNEFIKQNIWLKNQFNYEFANKSHLIQTSKFQLSIQKILEFPLKNRFGDFVEAILASIMKKRAFKKSQKLQDKSGIIISDIILKFHDTDMREKISILWKKRISMFEKYFIPRAHDFEKQGLWQYPQTSIPSEVHFQDIFDTKSEER